MNNVSRPKSDAVKDIDIADILGQKYRRRIDIGHIDIDPSLFCMFEENLVQFNEVRTICIFKMTRTSCASLDI